MGRRGLTDKSVDLCSLRQGTGDQIPVENKHMKKKLVLGLLYSSVFFLIYILMKRDTYYSIVTVEPISSYKLVNMDL